MNPFRSIGGLFRRKPAAPVPAPIVVDMALVKNRPIDGFADCALCGGRNRMGDNLTAVERVVDGSTVVVGVAHRTCMDEKLKHEAEAAG